MIQHRLDIYSPDGTAMLTQIRQGEFIRLAYAIKEDEPGVMDLDLPMTFDLNLLPIDAMVEIYRGYGPGSMKLEGETVWFLRRPDYGEDERGRELIRIQAHSALEIADHYTVPYNDDSIQAVKQGACDDVMIDIIEENMGSSATDTERDLGFRLATAAKFSLCPQITKSFSRAGVLATLQEIAAYSRGKGTYLCFDIVRTGIGIFEFRTYATARGTDHSSDSTKPVIISKSNRNLSRPWVSNDWTKERNYIYALGEGAGSARAVATAHDDARIGVSPFGRRELSYDASNANDADELQAEADTALEANRPKKIFTGIIQPNDGALYGVHWDWGDIVTAQAYGQSFDCHVEAVRVTVDEKGEETIEGQLRSESDV